MKARKQWLREMADELVEDALDDGLTVTRLPTMIEVRCPCGHHKRVAVPPGIPRPRFRCPRCGTRSL